MSPRDPLNQLAAVTKAGEITFRNYATGAIATREPDGSYSYEWRGQWRCMVETNDGGETVGKGQTPLEAVRSALKKVPS